MENMPKPSPEEIKKWREENKDKLNPQHDFQMAPDGSMMDMSEMSDEDKEALRDQIQENLNQ